MNKPQRPSWQTDECPAWCVTEHREDDLPDDRVHDSVATSLTVTTRDTSTPSRTAAVELLLVRFREVDDDEDWLHLMTGEGSGPGLTLSPEGARALGRTLLAVANTGAK